MKFNLFIKALHKDGLSTALALLYVCWSSANTFLYCFLGNSATEKLLQMNEWLWNSNWHELRIEHQKFFIMLIANSQRPLHFHSFGIANLTLETYAKVCVEELIEKLDICSKRLKMYYVIIFFFR